MTTKDELSEIYAPVIDTEPELPEPKVESIPDQIKYNNLIDVIRDTINEGLEEINPDWAETLACAPIAVMTGNNRFIIDKLGKIRANFVSIIIGLSRLGYKTAPLKKLRDLDIMLELAINNQILADNGYTPATFKEAKKIASKSGRKKKDAPDTSELKEKIADIEGQFVHYVLPETFSSEGLLNMLTKDENKNGTIHSDEFTSMVKGSKTKEYMANIFETISRLYDNEMASEATISRGYQDAGTTNITIVSATTPYLFTVLDSGFFQQGTGNRILWVMGSDIKTFELGDENLKFVDFFYSPMDNELQQAKTQEIVQKLMRISKLPEGAVPVSGAAGVMLFSYMNSNILKAIEIIKNRGELDPEASLLGGLALNAMKLSLARCMGRVAMIEEENRIVAELEISEEDAQWAIDKMDRHLIHYKRMIEMGMKITETGGYNNISKETDRILYLLDKFDNSLTNRDISRYTKWTTQHRERVLGAMREANLITQVTEAGGLIKYKRCSEDKPQPTDLTSVLK
jgi:hypothetical protein